MLSISVVDPLQSLNAHFPRDVPTLRRPPARSAVSVVKSKVSAFHIGTKPRDGAPSQPALDPRISGGMSPFRRPRSLDDERTHWPWFFTAGAGSPSA
jgi:hypothetical protein